MPHELTREFLMSAAEDSATDVREEGTTFPRIEDALAMFLDQGPDYPVDAFGFSKDQAPEFKRLVQELIAQFEAAKKKNWLDPTAKIETEPDYLLFQRYIVEQRGVNYHPDNPFEDYINGDTGKPTFTKAEVAILNEHIRAAFVLFGTRVYELGLAEFQTFLSAKKHVCGQVHPDESHREWETHYDISGGP